MDVNPMTLNRPREAFLTAGSPEPLAQILQLPDVSTFELFDRLVADDPCPVLLESGRGGEGGQRYSIIASDPSLIFRTTGSRLELLARNTSPSVCQGDPISAFRDLLHHMVIPQPAGFPAFIGGAIGYLGYDLAHRFERLPRITPDDVNLPDMELAFFDRAAVIDHQTKTLWLLFTPFQERFLKEPRQALYEEGLVRLAELSDRLTRPPSAAAPEMSGTWSPPSIVAGMTQCDYEDKVRRCLDYIAAGDVYQANLSHRFTVELGHRSPRIVYRRLRAINPSPFSALLELPSVTLVGCSPERLVRLVGRHVETRPIAGTRPRGQTIEEDVRLTEELLLNEKERAEHLMLVDLERNDLGRVCTYGSVEVNDYMAIERYSHVSHIVSNVRGLLMPGRDMLDLVRAVFPGGTVTGVPKVRCMEILEELEPVRRGPYTGSIGYFSAGGTLDLNITIRTLVVKNRSAYLHVGAGIVADSDPAREYAETLFKAEALLKAVRECS
jgi:aminodeoxychorismate synthase component I